MKTLSRQEWLMTVLCVLLVAVTFFAAACMLEPSAVPPRPKRDPLAQCHEPKLLESQMYIGKTENQVDFCATAYRWSCADGREVSASTWLSPDGWFSE